MSFVEVSVKIDSGHTFRCDLNWPQLESSLDNREQFVYDFGGVVPIY